MKGTTIFCGNPGECISILWMREIIFIKPEIPEVGEHRDTRQQQSEVDLEKYLQHIGQTEG